MHLSLEARSNANGHEHDHCCDHGPVTGRGWISDSKARRVPRYSHCHHAHTTRRQLTESHTQRYQSWLLIWSAIDLSYRFEGSSGLVGSTEDGRVSAWFDSFVGKEQRTTLSTSSHRSSPTRLAISFQNFSRVELSV